MPNWWRPVPKPATPSEPHVNLTEDPYFTDGLRLVFQLSGGRTVAVEDVEFLDWQESDDPNRSAKENTGPAAGL